MRIPAAALARLDADRLKGIRRGVEKESLRATADGALALTPHPIALGSALTHPHITTDYSESQVELITGVHATPETCLEELLRVHQFTYRALGAAGGQLHAQRIVARDDVTEMGGVAAGLGGQLRAGLGEGTVPPRHCRLAQRQPAMARWAWVSKPSTNCWAELTNRVCCMVIFPVISDGVIVPIRPRPRNLNWPSILESWL